MIEIEFLRQAQFSFDGSRVFSVVQGEKVKSQSPQSEKILRHFVDSGWAKLLYEEKEVLKKETKVKTPSAKK